MEAAGAQPLQVPIVSEGVHAAACLVKLASVGTSVEAKLEDIFNLITDPSKQLFYNEKFMSNCGAVELQSLASMTATILTRNIYLKTRLTFLELFPPEMRNTFYNPVSFFSLLLFFFIMYNISYIIRDRH